MKPTLFEALTSVVVVISAYLPISSLSHTRTNALPTLHLVTEYAIWKVDAVTTDWQCWFLPKDKDEGWFSKENAWSLVCSVEMPTDNVTSSHLPQIATRKYTTAYQLEMKRNAAPEKVRYVGCSLHFFLGYWVYSSKSPLFCFFSSSHLSYSVQDVQDHRAPAQSYGEWSWFATCRHYHITADVWIYKARIHEES